MALNSNENPQSQTGQPRAGARIRARRLDLGIKQVELARACDISAAYLNLIEHDRRAIAGALLNRIARHLSIDPARLSEGAGNALTAVVESAAASRPTIGAEAEKAEELAQRFPRYARLIERLFRDTQRLERQVEMLGDRLTHDPHLSASLHDVLSTVTAIRSTSGILVDDAELPGDWLARFHRNIHEDSQRLAEAADGLVRYLDSADEVAGEPSLPQEEVEGWLERQEWTVDAIEADPETDIRALLSDAGLSRGARVFAEALLARYASDVRGLRMDALARTIAEVGEDPRTVAARLGVPLSLVLRRMAMSADGGGPRGLVLCDGSGTLTFRRPIDAFPLPRYGAACPLWPLFEALRQPQVPLRQVVEMPGDPASRFVCDAIAELHWPDGYDGPGVVEAVMLIRTVDSRQGEARAVGPSCRICPRAGCAARREPSILSADSVQV